MNIELNALYGKDGKPLALTDEQIDKFNAIGFPNVVLDEDLMKAIYQQEPINVTCNGCAYESRTDIEIHLRRCTRCKRAYSKREDRDFHDDLYLDKKETEE